MDKVKLGDVLSAKRGMSLPGTNYAEEGSLIRLTLGNFDYPAGGFKENTSKKDIYYVGEVAPEFILNEGDVITPLTEQVAGLLGETARIPESGIYVQSGDIALLEPIDGKLDKSFMSYLVASPLVKKQLGAAAQQTKIRHTSPDAIEDCIVWIPGYREQEKIGALLDLINSKIANNQRVIRELEDTARLIYDYWFTQFDFPDENGSPYRSSGGKMVWNDELKREIPEGWEVGSLYRIANFINGLACQKHRPKLGDEGLPVIKIKEMHDGISPETERVSSDIPDKNKISAGDILFSWSASLEVMYWAGEPAGLNQHIFKVAPLDAGSSEFVYQCLKSYVQVFVKMAEARKTTMGHITTDHLNQSLIIIPPVDLMVQFQNKIAGTRSEYLRLNEENDALAHLRDWLLPMLMNGQAKVR